MTDVKTKQKVVGKIGTMADVKTKQKVVVKIDKMTDIETKQNVMETAADIDGLDYIGTDLKNKTLTVIGTADPMDVVKMMKKFGKVELVFVGSAKDDE